MQFDLLLMPHLGHL